MSPDWAALALLAATALVVGLFIGTTSIGGVLLIPALIVWGGLPVHQAAATALASFLFTGSLGTWMYLRRGTFEWRLVWPLCVGALPAGYLGALLAARTDAALLSTIIGMLIVLASLLILRPPPVLARARGRSPAAEASLILAIGASSGFGSGLSGAGGPIFSVPLMIVFGFQPLAAMGAAMGFQIVAALSGSAAHLLAGAIVPEVLALIAVFQVLGVSVGVRLAHALPTPVLRKFAAWLCVAAGALMVFRSLG